MVAITDLIASGLFKSAPETAIFISIAIGYLIGRVKVGFFQLGSVAGTLLAAVFIGQFQVDGKALVVSGQVKAVCFALFIFSVGYKSGPQFFASLNRASTKPILLCIVVCCTGLAAVVVAARLFGLDMGTAAGTLAGACTESAAIGTAGEAIDRLNRADADALKTNIAAAYAMTYLFGTLSVIVFIRSVAPKLLGIDLKASAKEYEEKQRAGEPPAAAGYNPIALRAFRVQKGSRADGKAVTDVLKQLGEGTQIGKILHRGEEVVAGPGVVLTEGDIVGVTGLRGLLSRGDDIIGPEVGDPRVLSDVVDVADVVVTHKELVGKTLLEISEQIDPEQRRGVYLQQVERQGRILPRSWSTRLARGDVLRLTGWKERLSSVIAAVGYEVRASDKTDLVYLALGVVLGTIVGLQHVPIGGVPLTLGIGGGVLVAGLVFGWLRSRMRRFGHFPTAAQSVLSDFGLSAFVAVVGITAGPQMLSSMQSKGPGLIGIGIGCALLPQIVGLLFGKLVLRLHPLVLLGGLAGSQTVTAALNAILEEADSSAPVVGYTVTYGIGNVLLTLWGPVLIAILA